MVNFLGDLAAKITGGNTSPTGGDLLKLLVNGQSFEGWHSISVKRSIKAISGSFSLGVVDKWAQDQTPWKMVPGDECTVKIGSDVVVTGYVDQVAPSFDSDSRGLAVSGRDKAGDLVDCSIDFKPGTWTNISLKGIAKKVAAPFGIGVTVSSGAAASAAEVFLAWKINQGESPFETLERAARLRGVLLMNDGVGNIVITRAGSTRVAQELVQGQNIVSASAEFDHKDRFSKYVVKSQTNGLDGADPAVDFSCHASATDPGVARSRPLLIIAEGASTAAICRKRAKWEASVRIGKSSRFKVTVLGWRKNDGALWAINELVHLKAPWLGVNLELLITDVDFQKGDGTTTQLSLEPSQAYDPDPTYISRKDPWRQLVIQESKR